MTDQENDAAREEALHELVTQVRRSEQLATTIPTRDQVLRLYHFQKLATNATRSTRSERRLTQILSIAYGPSLGQHLAYKLIKVEGGDVAGWLLTLSTENAATFWNSPKMDV